MALRKINKKGVLLLGLVIVIMAIGLLIYSGGSALLFASDSVEDLPSGTVQLTPTVPGMGEHWANPEDMPLGPIYLVYQGEVIGIEYMYSEDMLSEVSIPTPEGDEIFEELANLGVDHQVDHIDVGFMSDGHEGFEGPHWDIHAYYVAHAEHMSIPGQAPIVVREIIMTAKKFEFKPNTITVNQGDLVRLKIEALDRTHGFALPEFGVEVRLNFGEITEVEFVADKKGTFEFKCVVRCGSGHRSMKGRLVVQ